MNVDPQKYSVLVSIDSHPKTGALLRAAANKADSLGVKWIAIYAETAEHFTLSRKARERVLRFLTLAEEMGAKVIHQQENDITAAVTATIEEIEDSQDGEIQHIIIGKSDIEGFWNNLKASSSERLTRALRKSAIEVQIIPLSGSQYAPTAWERLRIVDISWRGVVFAILAILAAYGLSELLKFSSSTIEWQVNKQNVIGFFLIACVITALRCGFLAGSFSALLAFAVINYFYIPPLYNFNIEHSAESISLTVFLVSALIASFLGAYSHASKTALLRKEKRSQALYEMYRISSRASDQEEVLELLHEELSRLLEMDIAFFLPSTMCQSSIKLNYPKEMHLTNNDLQTLDLCWDKIRTTGLGTNTNKSHSDWRFEPLVTPNGEIGVLGIKIPHHIRLDASFGRLLTALADQAASILERIELTRLMGETKISEEREKLRSTLLSSVSHDLKTPLASIIGSLSVYQRMKKAGRLSEKNSLELTETALEEAQRLDSFISNILDMTRIESDAIVFKYDWVDPVVAVKRVGKRLRQRLKNHSLKISEPKEALEIKCDAIMTEQILQNIIDNATKYAPNSTNIDVSFKKKKGGMAYIIRDHGAGIPDEKLEAIFDKYERLKQTDRQVAGTGLGLAISKAVIEKQEGCISVRNHEEGGSEFTLWFPHVRTAEAQKRKVA